MTREEVLSYLELPSPAMREALDLILRVAPLMTTVYISGPSGSGKEFAARAVHAFSNRAAAPFVAVNCGAIPRDLLESELFGSEKGAYTGSVRTRPGLLETAAGGTLFLDELGDMPLDMQVKLLRVLEDRRFARVGGSQEIKADVRLVCATHRDLMRMVEEGRFREDLYYRINVFPIAMKGLDERREDIPRLVELILKRFRGQGGVGESPKFQPGAIAALQASSWPGNVRQLRNVLERCSVLYPGQVVGRVEIERIAAPRKAIDRVEETRALFSSLQGLGFGRSGEPAPETAPLFNEGAEPEPPSEAPADPAVDLEPAPPLAPDLLSIPADVSGFLRATPDFNFRDHITKIEIAFIKGALSEMNGSVSGAARMLGLQRTTLIEKMRKYAIDREEA
jgi:sigma-54 specific flagellar transcriptional regulator A